MKPTTCATMALAFLVLGGCEEKDRKQAVESAKTISKDAGVKLDDMLDKGKDAVVAAARNQAADLDQAILDLKQRASTLSGEAKIELEQGIRNLDASRVTLSEKLETLANASETTWKDFVREVDRIVTSMRRTIEIAVQRARENRTK